MFLEVAVGNVIIVILFGILLLLRNSIIWFENCKLLGKRIRTKGKVVDLVYDESVMMKCNSK